ncbi:hypothetical protein E4U09_001894 [Claviceps aff. purpurea]|uniref:CFEM domain-containing protein n=1 Tax=Claviceps aff. purpurea TaxID=1967640 RepID=A0A9P7QJ96_9HYPO|nr:hypothetical protein E4U09_001894 [Claviceps aff. purpurea]
MRVSAVATAAMAGLVSAQNLNDIPACAMPCMQTAASKTSCPPADFGCLCSKDNFAAMQAAATSCVIEKCGAKKAAGEVLPAVEKLCSAVGGTTGGSGASAPAPIEEYPHGQAQATPAPIEEYPQGEATPVASGLNQSAPPAYSAPPAPATPAPAPLAPPAPPAYSAPPAPASPAPAPPAYSSAEGSMDSYDSMPMPTGASESDYCSECEGEDGHVEAADMPGETGVPKNGTGGHTGEHTGAPRPSSSLTAGAAGLAPVGVLALMIAGALAL